MRVSRRSFLGGSIASIGLMFGGFGWREPEAWEGGEWSGEVDSYFGFNLIEHDRGRVTAAEVQGLGEGFPTRAQVEEMMKPPPPDFVGYRYEGGKKIRITQEGIERDREGVEGAFG